MNNKQIIRIIQECSDILNIELGSESFGGNEEFTREYENVELVEFIRDLAESSSNSGMLMLEKHLVESRFKEMMKVQSSPVIVFDKD